jgi:phosphatidylglycerophosphate synthase
MVRRVHYLHRFSGEVAAALCAASILTAGLSLVYGLGPLGLGCGLFVATATAFALTRAMNDTEQRRLTPADRVTLCRAFLTAAVTALVAGSFVAQVSTVPLVALAAAALALDAVDGRVARRTGTVHALGARFDMEVDALLILVLSAFVAADRGWWVLSIGVAHYVLLLARHHWPWLRVPLPPRHWCKVVAALQGIVLTVAASDLLTPGVTTLALAAAGALLAESFGREVWQLWQLRTAHDRHPGEVARASRTEPIAVDLGAHR